MVDIELRIEMSLFVLRVSPFRLLLFSWKFLPPTVLRPCLAFSRLSDFQIFLPLLLYLP